MKRLTVAVGNRNGFKAGWFRVFWEDWCGGECNFRCLADGAFLATEQEALDYAKLRFNVPAFVDSSPFVAAIDASFTLVETEQEVIAAIEFCESGQKPCRDCIEATA